MTRTVPWFSNAPDTVRILFAVLATSVPWFTIDDPVPTAAMKPLAALDTVTFGPIVSTPLVAISRKLALLPAPVNRTAPPPDRVCVPLKSMLVGTIPVELTVNVRPVAIASPLVTASKLPLVNVASASRVIPDSRLVRPLTTRLPVPEADSVEVAGLTPMIEPPLRVNVRPVPIVRPPVRVRRAALERSRSALRATFEKVAAAPETESAAPPGAVTVALESAVLVPKVPVAAPRKLSVPLARSTAALTVAKPPLAAS